MKKKIELNEYLKIEYCYKWTGIVCAKKLSSFKIFNHAPMLVWVLKIFSPGNKKKTEKITNFHFKTNFPIKYIIH